MLESRLFYYLVKRIIAAIPTIFGVIVFTFLIVRLSPGDPAVLLAGESGTPEYIENIRRAYGLDKPLSTQFQIYLVRLLQGDWGYSLSFNRPVLEVILERLPTTILLAVAGLSIAILLGILLGILAALKRNRIPDYIVSSTSLLFFSIPIFVIAGILIYIFGVNYRIFPLGGIVRIGARYESVIDYALDVGWHLVLPALSLALVFMPIYARLTRSSMIESIFANYIIAAKARGLAERIVIFKHALKNALLPIITMAGVQLGALIGGVVITETIFSWPGLGRLTVDAIQLRDYPLLTGIFIFTSIAVIFINLVVDIIYTIIDPRVKLR